MRTVKWLMALLAVSFVIAVAAGQGAPADDLLFSEDFDDGVADGFTTVSGAWSVTKTGKYVQMTANPAGPYRSWVNAADEYTIGVEYTPVSGQATKVLYAHADSSENYRVDLWLNQCNLSIPAWGQGWETRSFVVGGLNLSYNRTYYVKVIVSQEGVRVSLDDYLVQYQEWADKQPLGDGKIGVGTFAASSRFERLWVYGDGILIFYEGFEDGAANGFTEHGGTWTVANGAYAQTTVSPAGPYWSWVDIFQYVIEVDCTPLSGQETKIIYAHADAGEDYRVDFWLDQSRLCIPASGQGWATRNVSLSGLNLAYDKTYHVKIVVNWAGVKVWLNDVLRHDEPWANDTPMGDAKIGVGTYAGTSRFDNIVVSSTGMPAGKTWYADAKKPLSGDGTTWPRAFRTLQEGIDRASNGDTVMVAYGTYFENINLKGKNITVRGTDPLDAGILANTIIDGSEAGPTVTLAGSENETCVLSGLSIAYGRALYGGGICGGTTDVHTHATIKNCVVASNSADDGGGIAFCDGPIQNNQIGSNWYTRTEPHGNGGGLFQCNGPIQNNTITKNRAFSGGGLAYCGGLILGNTISENLATYGGGLAYCGGTVRSNNIGRNEAFWSGGGLYRCHGTIQSNTISGNSRAEHGGGLYDCDGVIRSNTISQNSASYRGGGLFGCDGTIQDNTISENSTEDGGGLYQCHGTIRNNVISKNSGTYWGGGLSDCDAQIQDNTITENTGAKYGGGLAYCDLSIHNNTITLNRASGWWPYGDGGGLYQCGAGIKNNTITLNFADRDGGGLAYCSGPMWNNTIMRNSADGFGGGLAYCDGGIWYNIIAGNDAGRGGGLSRCNGVIRNNLVARNSAQTVGGGLEACNLRIENNTIAGNSALGEGGGGLADCGAWIQNCIIWGNTASAYAQLRPGTIPIYSCVQSWSGGGQENINADPGFVDWDGPDENPETHEDNNYRLKEGSPCIDRGMNEVWMQSGVDLDGNPRLFLGEKFLIVDMGAYEYGSFRFKILKIDRTPNDEARLTWRSRSGDQYAVWWCIALSSGKWADIATVASQGESTTWTDPDRIPLQKSYGFYRIELR